MPVGEAAAVSAALLWAVAALVFTEAGRRASPVAVNASKTSLAALFFCVFLWITTGTPLATDLAREDWTLLALSGVCGLTIGDSLGPFVGIWLMTVALDRTETGIALTLLGTTPVWLLPLGSWMQGDHPTPREIVGIVVTLGGVAVLLLSG